MHSPKHNAQYVIGIDLGTTNSALAYVDTGAAEWRVQTLRLPQWVGAGLVEERDLLPSFHYEFAHDEKASEAGRLPWDATAPGHAVGVGARDRGAETPARLICSAKSWLCHPGIDRTAAVLPWRGATDVTRLSPVAVSARFLAHLRVAWDHTFATAPLAQQHVILGVPASFDEVARELTVKAAETAGLGQVTLLEEPQAAFYAWVHWRGQGWREQLPPGSVILVCDVGGGTTDLTLIEVRQAPDGRSQFHRVAVGDHLILGGDNLDLALAHHVEDRLGAGRALDPARWAVLVRRCQAAKEVLLGAQPPERVTLSIPGSGARVVGGAMQAELTREEATAVLVEGFLPRVGLDVRPATVASGFREFGLPFAPDPGITRYLAAFLCEHRGVLQSRAVPELAVRPDAVLVNGGFFASQVLKARLLDALTGWFRAADSRYAPRLLETPRPDLAVAQGAAYYGMVCRGQGEAIKAGLARAYFIGAGTTPSQPGAATAVCLVPYGQPEGTSVELRQREFELRLRQPVGFDLYASSRRTQDQPGDLVACDPLELTALPPIRTVIATGKQARQDVTRVRLLTRLTEVGTLDIRCVEAAGTRQWRLEFDVRAKPPVASARTSTVLAEQEDETAGARLAACRQAVSDVFGGGAPAAKPEQLMKRLEQLSGQTRLEWAPGFLRELWRTVLDSRDGRRLSPVHEARWLNLLGFTLRPGFGCPVDDWRVDETWKLVHDGVRHPRNDMVCGEWWVLWRRIGGGLDAGRQKALAAPLLAALRQRVAGRKTERVKAGPHETAEIWRVLGACESLDPSAKDALGDLAVHDLQRLGLQAHNGGELWALARLGAREPAYGALNLVLPPETVEKWLEALGPATARKETAFAVMQLTRRTGDRYRDVTPAVRKRALAWLRDSGAPPHYAELVENGGGLAASEQQAMLGDALPAGLRLVL